MQTNISEIRDVFVNNGWFEEEGMYVLFDGQFGSTGKGLLASVIAESLGDKIDSVATNAGPNSGHTGYYNGEKIMTQQIPVASIVMDRMEETHTVYLNGGAVIDPPQLEKELGYYTDTSTRHFVLHPSSSVIKESHKGEQLSKIASTGKGVGFAMADKLIRNEDAVSGYYQDSWDWAKENKVESKIFKNPKRDLGRCFVETAQGWSLGINSGFYPYTTSRECSVSQAISDMGCSPKDFKKSVVCLRTFPIRVGNTKDGYSGDVYPDQEEIDFEKLGVEPERTTVTGRIRRIFTFSWEQYYQMVMANKPDGLFLNFINYLPEEEHAPMIKKMVRSYKGIIGHDPDFVVGGYGPYNEDVKVLFDGKDFKF